MDGYKKIVNIKWLLLSFVLLNACSVAKKEYVGIYVNNYPDFTGNFIFNKKKDTLRSIIQKESSDTIKYILNFKKSENLSIDYKNNTKPDTIRKSFASNKKLPRKSPIEIKEEIKTDSISLKLEAKQKEKKDSLQVNTSDKAKHLKGEKKITESKQNKKQDLKKINNRATSIDSAINKVKKDTVSLNHNNDSVNKQKKHLNNFTSPKKNLKTKENDNYKETITEKKKAITQKKANEESNSVIDTKYIKKSQSNKSNNKRKPIKPIALAPLKAKFIKIHPTYRDFNHLQNIDCHNKKEHIPSTLILKVYDTIFINKTKIIKTQGISDTISFTLYYQLGKIVPNNFNEIIKALKSDISIKKPQKIFIKGFTDKSGNPKINKQITYKRIDFFIKNLSPFIDIKNIYIQNFADYFATKKYDIHERRIEIKLVSFNL